jgi:squalene-hopene/tetraprenyl-beta-curcumene cyclase
VGTREAVRTGVASSIRAAREHLRQQAEGGFPETRHAMRFPRAAGFTGASEAHSTDVFPRAVLAGVLLDTVELDDDDDFRAQVQALARREADHVAAHRLRDRAGGWSYFPDLPELPPDLDSLSAAMLLFSRAAPDHLPLCDGPVALALGQSREDGAIGTWLMSPEDDARDRARMEEGVDRFWGHGADVDVLAHFYYALWTRDPQRHMAAVRRGARFVQARQAPDGAWEAAWYHGQAYAAGLCLRLLRSVGEGATAAGRAVDLLRRRQRSDGSWGVKAPDPQETALALWAIGVSGRPLPEADRERALGTLIDAQRPDGSWPASPWIKMDVGRARGGGGPILSYASATLTTAFVLRALLT